MSEKPDIVYGRLLESAHISGYGFERMVDELEWLLEGDRWQSVGQGFTDVGTFMASVDLSAFNLESKKRLIALMHAAQPQISQKAIAEATDTSPATVSRELHGDSRETRRPSNDRADQDESRSAVSRETFDRSPKDVADLSRARTSREAKEAEREAMREQNHQLTLGVDPPQGPARTVVIDPPWDWGDEGDIDQFGRANPVYATKSEDDVAQQFADEIAPQITDDAHIYLWITNRSLPKGFRLLEGWGFRYVTALTWVKPSFGMGNYFRGQTEHILFGVRGSLPLLRSDVGTVIAAPRGDDHSAKPDELYELVETCSPGPWMDVYARRERTGWITWGAEVA